MGRPLAELAPRGTARALFLHPPARERSFARADPLLRGSHEPRMRARAARLDPDGSGKTNGPFRLSPSEYSFGLKAGPEVRFFRDDPSIASGGRARAAGRKACDGAAGAAFPAPVPAHGDHLRSVQRPCA